MTEHEFIQKLKLIITREIQYSDIDYYHIDVSNINSVYKTRFSFSSYASILCNLQRVSMIKVVPVNFLLGLFVKIKDKVVSRGRNVGN